MFRKHRWMAIALALITLSWVATSWAGGSIRLTKSSVTEKAGKWKLSFKINYGKKPDLPHIPMIFKFTQTAIYERSLTDDSPDKPIERTVPVHNAEPKYETVDVGFSNAKGELFSTTKLTIKLRRDSDFEAGEYNLTVKESRNGRKIGGTVKLRLKGKNKVINRKSISFSAPAPKPKKEPEPGTADDDDGPKAAEDMGPDLSDIPDDTSDGEPGDDQKVDPKQGGCGCEIVGVRTKPYFGLIFGALGLAAIRRRRTRTA